MPRIEYDGKVHEFPDDFTDDDIRAALQSLDAPAAAAAPPAPAQEPSELDQEIATLTRRYEGKPLVPRGDLYKREDIIRSEAENRISGRQREQAERAVMDSRNAGERTRDTAAFGLSVVPRTLTRGQYGAGDVAGALGFEDIAKSLSQAEQDFAYANRPGLEVAAALGEATAGIPLLQSMGGVPGQTMRAMATGARQLPSELRHLARSERGAVPIPGGGNHRIPGGNPPSGGGGAPPTNTAAAVDPEALSMRHGPSRNELIQAGERISRRLPEGESFHVPRMVAGNAAERHLAGGLANIPYAGTPVVNAWDRGLFGLGRAKDVAVREMGTAGDLGAGSAIRSRVADWMKNPTALDETGIDELYAQVGKAVKDTPVELSNLRKLQKEIAGEKATSTSKEGDAALAAIDDMLDRKQFPKGMPYSALLKKRKEIGARMSGDIVAEAGTSQTALRRVYGAMTEDMKFAIKRGGGQKALDKWEEANTAAQNVADQRKILERFIGSDGSIPPEKIVARIKEAGKSRRGDITALRILKRVMPEDEFNDLAATIADDLGRNRKGDFSIFHFSTDYGQYSDAFKNLAFGKSREALDDIVKVAKGFERLHGQSWNTSKTGIANAVLQLVMNPIALIGGGAALFTDIGTMGSGLGTAAGFRGARSMAWTLAKPAVAREASKVFRAYYNTVRAGPAIAKREQSLAAAIRSYSTALAGETGGNPAAIEDAITRELNRIRRGERNKS